MKLNEQQKAAVRQMYQAVSAGLFAMGYAGANADTKHPMRDAWERCQDAERMAVESGLLAAAENQTEAKS